MENLQAICTRHKSFLMKILTLYALVVIVFVLFSSTSSLSPSYAQLESATPTRAMYHSVQENAVESEYRQMDGSFNLKENRAAEMSDVPQKMISRSADQTFEVQNVSSALKKLNVLVVQYKGYVTNSQDSKHNGYLTVMVPSSSLDAFLASAASVATRVVKSSTNSVDHSSEYVDGNSRYKNLELTHNKLVQLMDKAVSVQDILLVQQELTRVTEQMELIKGRLKYIENQVAYSKVIFQLTEYYQYAPPSWSPVETFGQALKMLVLFVEKAIDIVIVLVVAVVVPLCVLLALVRCIFCTCAEEGSQACKNCSNIC